MNLSVGIVGLPNVGKSTLFNALLKKQVAFVANYPFATIEPNVGIVPVPDPRLDELVRITKEEEKMSELPPTKPATVKFVDIAGLVKGAAEGAGLGNKFLSHIREVSVIAHVVRAFVDENVIREGSSEDPEKDYATVQTELILSDLQSLENSKLKSLKSKSLASERGEQFKTQNLLNRLTQDLNSGVPVRDVNLSDDEKQEIKSLFLLTTKPEIIVLNVSEDDYSLVNIDVLVERYSKLLLLPKDRLVVICAKIEAELSELSNEDQKQYLKDLGLHESGLERLIKKAYETLGLISFLTAGEKEVRAWTIEKGTKAIDTAGVIHTDFTKKFIKAEIVSHDDFVKYNGWKGSRENGKARLEGRDYVMQDGDVVEFKIGT
ncbi:redox-regulated ATPase YchF [Candidatus Roizmanbacteria bacterium]|nr:redox-regulated ATPase YchF [Candidatus Roizmanbacteria bacterium]